MADYKKHYCLGIFIKLKIKANFLTQSQLAFCYLWESPPNVCLTAKMEVILKRNIMPKIQKISQIQPTLCFTEFDFLSRYRKSFEQSDLGRLHSSFPFSSFCKSIGLVDNPKGRCSYFSSSGKVALMLLKSYTGLSDSDLLDGLNANIHFQLFCGIWIDPDYPLTNAKIVSAIRCELGSLLNIDSAQQILATHWKPYLDNLQVCMTDATCYESFIRFPTNIKLLFESVDWLYRHLCKLCKRLQLSRPRNKYAEVKSAYLSHSKKRKRKASTTRMLTRRLLHLLEKLLDQMHGLIDTNRKRLVLHGDFMRRLNVICKVLLQQQQLFAGKKVTDRIVSIDKHYIRPIVRGKEVKSVEFGAKVNNIQVGGISFIQNLCFDAFNEGTLLKDCITLQQRIFKKNVRQVGADAIYATNANRRFCSHRSILTSFVRKGRAGKDESQRKILRSALSKERATRLEGSFGTQKNHYGLQRIKARKKDTEVLWIFFGIHTANAVLIAHRKKKLQEIPPGEAS